MLPSLPGNGGGVLGVEVVHVHWGMVIDAVPKLSELGSVGARFFCLGLTSEFGSEAIWLESSKLNWIFLGSQSISEFY